MNNLAVAYGDAGRPQEAIPLQNEALEKRRERGQRTGVESPGFQF
jgi:hypothetical protein